MTNFCRRSALTGAILTATLTLSSAIADTPTTFESIGPENFEVSGMSANGEVLVGTFSFAGPAFRWTRDGGTEFIGGNGGQIKVSRDGTVISGNADFNGHNEAALWLGGEDWQTLGGLGTSGCPDFSNGYNISGNGQVIVGLGWDGCGARGFRWEAATGMVDLGNLGPGQYSRANVTNFDGSIIAGWDDSLFDRRGARWVNGVESLLADNTGDNIYLGSAEGMTPDGLTIVGGEAGLVGSELYNEAYIWTEAEGGSLIGKLPGGGAFSRAFAYAVSDDGELVAGGSGGQFRRGFIWSKSVGILDLQDYLLELGVTGLDGWTLGNVRAMSADGTKLSGWGINPNGFFQGWLIENLATVADTDGDEVLDALDNCSAISNPDQRDTNGDGYGNACDPDLDNNGVVNFSDVSAWTALFNTSCGDVDGDFNGDGNCNFGDYSLFSTFFLQPPGPSGLAP